MTRPVRSVSSPPSASPRPAGKESSLTLERGLALLQAVADSESEAPTISDLAATIGASRAAVYRLLVPLQERGLVRREGSRVRLGLGLLQLAAKVAPQLRLAALPALRELAETVGATAHLTVADGDEAQAVAVVEPSWTAYHVAYRVGTRHSLRRGAAGKAIGLRPGGPGWIATTGELQTGAHGIAAPVRGVPGLRASVGVVTFEPLDGDVVGPQVINAAAAVANALH
ncbi:MAG TPA: helix-turn-helix domain-containing protein [Actinoplanes sp.]|jgi:DNA-binding IclR family transcriptional regulator|nr:helix-turn-helix domain-containing protein [Actinoplanes sp.]